MSGPEDTGKAETAGARRAGDGPGEEEKKAHRIVHVDMDAFYAQIEQRDFPEKYAGEPIAVGGDPPKGVVKAASYEARPYGVRSAQPAVEADRQCPGLIFVSPRMEVYQKESRRIREILFGYTDLLEPLSLDEAYLDVTDPKKGPPSGTLVARRIREEIYEETGLTASAGVGPSKFVAKVASDQDKPDGLTVIRPEDQLDFIAGLPAGDFHGIGPVTEEKMQEMGIETGADLQDTPEKTLRRRFGKRGGHFKKLAMGEDDRPVKPDRERKSVGAERTFSDDVSDPEQMLSRLEPIAQRVAGRLGSAGPEGTPVRGRTVTLKLKSHDHDVSTRQTTLRRAVRSEEDLMRLAERLLSRPHPPEEPVRLLGLSVSSLTGREEGKQLELEFDQA
ncbi:DNA polymerase IV [Salinibacter ruber]|uniref:DNA polymerase IV n=1 Tax=Salinibacter ruber TaxID=146919 RepID=A0A9X2U4I7_9BACT|nr:DNA polymerase IV [Salinibacter ruber]MCS3671933.1 DNA polymerase-4 [Salinibacter ruber]MCS3859813.1 DNA polymerase-4 [Salinibacter ruber]MCS3866671.1 DNA polymerase-4 [Salinibacter ruber]MCS4142140.1 DNA polymerase-4 [Salinibacter ruber]